ncbi:MRC [Mytilus coruscus]|uniref:MRC n=1 Tax=Mytilus coruscus TaxID=42192 RepID=A0A6J8EGS6_MYTCO|nr:MRC [Mytilus coruscus]
MITTTLGVSWEDARYMCINDYGMDLAIICDNNVMTEVEYYLSLTSFSVDIWIGLVWNASLLDFVWVNNEVLSWLPPWYEDEPNCMPSANVFCHSSFSFIQNCVRMSNGKLEWKTQACFNRNGALCQNLTSPCNTTTTTESITSTNSSTITPLYKTTTTTESITSTNSSTTTSLSSTTTTAESITPTNSSTTTPLYNTSTTAESITTTTTSTATSTTNPNFSGVTVATTCPPCNCIITPQNSSRNSSSLDVYKVDKHKTGAYIRMHTSADDNRLSAKVMGYTGLSVICTVFLVVILIDLTRIKERRKNKSFLKS